MKGDGGLVKPPVAPVIEGARCVAEEDDALVTCELAREDRETSWMSHRRTTRDSFERVARRPDLVGEKEIRERPGVAEARAGFVISALMVRT